MMNSISLNSQLSHQLDSPSQDNVYVFVKFLGRGSFGSVNLYRHNVDNSLVVWKEINLTLLNDRFRNDAFAEIDILSMIDHPNVISYYKYFFDEKHLYIELSYCNGGTLAQLIKDQIEMNKYFSEETVLWYLYQLCNAVSYIHEIGIIHRDIKSANIFFMKSGLLKLGDFGIAKLLDLSIGLAETQVGTPFYMSPEIINGSKYSNKSDIWSIGIVLHELLALKKPFNATNELRIALQIIQYEPTKLDLDVYSSDLLSLASFILTKDPELRPSAKDILSHQLFSEKIIEYEYRIETLNGTSKRTALGLNSNEQDSAALITSSQSLPIVASKLSELYIWGGGKQTPQKLDLFKKENAPLKVCVSKTHYAVITVEKELYTWATPTQTKNSYAKLGHGKGSGLTKQPKRVESFEGIFIKQVSCGEDFTCCLTEDGLLYVFGTDYCGTLGLGELLDEIGESGHIYEPTLVPFFNENDLKIQQVSCGYSHVVALTTNNQVYTWGCGEYGRLGLGNEDDFDIPQRLSFKFNYKFVSVVAGSDCTFLITDKGRVLAFGNNESNKLGLNNQINGISSLSSSEIFYQRTPKLVNDLSPYKIIKISTGDTHSAAIDCFGRLFVMGSNKYGQLGLGDLKSHLGIKMVSGMLRGHHVTNVSSGDSFTICSTIENHVFAWGNRKDGRLGIEASNEIPTVSSPKPVFGSLYYVNDISSSHWYSVIIAEILLEAKQVKSMAYHNQRRVEPEQQQQNQARQNNYESLDSAYCTRSVSNQSSIRDFNDEQENEEPIGDVALKIPEEIVEESTEIPVWLKNDIAEAEFIPMDPTPKIESIEDQLKIENERLKEENRQLREKLEELRERLKKFDSSF